jgi:hypothetical protein
LIFSSQAASLSFFILQLQQPPTIRLIDTAKHKPDLSRSRSQTPVPASSSTPEPENLLAGLSFSSKPIITPKTGPVFGMPSMLSSLTAQAEQHPEADEMDIDVPPTDAKGKAKESGDALWLRPQRFFAPEAPTGLEGLFERTKIVDDITMGDATSAPSSGSRPSGARLPYSWNWWWGCAYASSLVLLAGLVYKVWPTAPNPGDSFSPVAISQLGPLDTAFFAP